MMTSQSRLLFYNLLAFKSIRFLKRFFNRRRARGWRGVRSLLSKCPLQEPAYDREIPPLIVSRENDGVLVALWSHFSVLGRRLYSKMNLRQDAIAKPKDETAQELQVGGQLRNKHAGDPPRSLMSDLCQSGPNAAST